MKLTEKKLMSFAKAASFIKVRNSSICIILSDRATSGEFYPYQKFFKNWFANFCYTDFFGVHLLCVAWPEF